VIAWLVAVAAVDAAAGPDADGVVLAQAAFDVQREFRPGFGADGRFEDILGDVMSENAAFDFVRERSGGQKNQTAENTEERRENFAVLCVLCELCG
jgi:hypothetical protein